jgi:2-dehydro-3-deoxyphosphooctonate aldolase (KDO 8-P synthase)
MSMTNQVTSPYTRPIQIGSATLGGGHPFVLLAGPVVSEAAGIHESVAFAEKLAAQTKEAEVPLIFRIIGANRENGLGRAFADTLSALREVRDRTGVSVAVDVTESGQISAAAELADMLQIPAARCRATDLILDAAHTGRPVNVEKDPSLTPADAVAIVETVASAGNWNVMLTDRGTTVGRDRLVVDFDGFSFLRETGFPLVFDAGSGDLATNGLTAGADGIALALTDGAIAALPRLLQQLKGIERESRG